jgi:hypothetical protein
MKKQHSGFIALFFVLGLSFTFLTWISLSSERVFEYVRLKAAFLEHRSVLHDRILCADGFINILIRSRYNLHLTGDSYDFERGMYFLDEVTCHITSVSFLYEDTIVKSVFFTISGFRFEYQFKNGFVDSIRSFNLF